MLNTSVVAAITNPGEVIYWLVFLVALAAVTAWAFGRKRKRRFEEDAKIPFEE